MSDMQTSFCQSRARFKLWRAGRRSGKTDAQVYDWGKWAFLHPHTINWYVAQDSATVKELTIPLFERTFPHELIKDYSKSDKCFTLFNGSYCYFKSANSADSLRGRKVHNLGCEEVAFWQNGADIYHNILRPQLSDTMGRASLVSSPPNKKAPTGAEWFRRLEQTFQEEINKGSTEYATFKSSIWENPYIDDEEKKALHRMTDPDTWAIEYLGEYCDKVGQVYWEFDPLTKKTIPEAEPIMRVRGLDFGISDNTACAWVWLLPDNRVHIAEEYVANNTDVPTHAVAIKHRTQWPVSWTVLDSACWARDASLTSVAKRFAAEGIGAIQATRDLDGSISDMKRLFSNGLITISPTCTELLKAIDGWQHGQHEPDILAATRYAIDGLIRNGKLLPPSRRVHKTGFDILEEEKEMVRRMKSINDAIAQRGRGKDLRFRLM
jgi:hypothetical protein